MKNIYKGLAGAALILIVAAVTKSMGVSSNISFSIVTAISGFAALWISRSAKGSGNRCAQ